eukprot:GSChrysophyteH2.ASY1.ANO1.48.1 assembled CDS
MKNGDTKGVTALRHRKMKPAVMAVERWFMHYALRYPASDPENAERDVVFPMFANMTTYDESVDPQTQIELVEDLCAAKDLYDDAVLIANDLLKISHNLALELRAERMEALASATSTTADTTGVVTLVRHKHTLDVMLSPTGVSHAPTASTSTAKKGAKGSNSSSSSVAPPLTAEPATGTGTPGTGTPGTGPTGTGPPGTGKRAKGRELLKLNPSHLDKLRAQYERASGRSLDTPEDEQEFLNRVFCLLARYQTIQGHGFQAAVAELAFGVLHKDLGVDLEVFASPLNSTFAYHCSAYPDTDSVFGSIGSFFDMNPVSGIFV